MRQIKFRAWDKELEMMMPPVDLSAPLQEYKWLGRKDVPIMQFTGLLDKNGKEIYEGDIFGKFGGDKDRPDEYEYYGKVYFDNDLLAFCVAESNGGWTYLNEYQFPEIIGNIYENPELLK